MQKFKCENCGLIQIKYLDKNAAPCEKCGKSQFECVEDSFRDSERRFKK